MQHLEQASPSTSVYRPEDEIDLVDLIGFLWRIRRFILVGITTGALGALGYALISSKKAENSATYDRIIIIPLAEQERVYPMVSPLPQPERIAKLNELLTSPETAQDFLLGLKNQGLSLAPGLTPEGELQWFISQQTIESDKQKLAKIVSTADGLLKFTGTWTSQSDPQKMTTAIVTSLNSMIDGYNRRLKLRSETEHQVQVQKMTAMIGIRTEISAQLFRLREMLGSISPATESLLSSPMPGFTETGAETEIGKVVRMIGVLEQSGKISKDQANTEKVFLAQHQARYIDLKGTEPTPPPTKQEQKAPTVLLPLTLGSESADSTSQTLSMATIGTPSTATPSFKKNPMILLVLGILGGGFLGTIAGGVAMFWRTNAERIRTALAS